MIAGTNETCGGQFCAEIIGKSRCEQHGRGDLVHALRFQHVIRILGHTAEYTEGVERSYVDSICCELIVWHPRDSRIGTITHCGHTGELGR